MLPWLMVLGRRELNNWTCNFASTSVHSTWLVALFKTFETARSWQYSLLCMYSRSTKEVDRWPIYRKKLIKGHDTKSQSHLHKNCVTKMQHIFLTFLDKFREFGSGQNAAKRAWCEIGSIFFHGHERFSFPVRVIKREVCTHSLFGKSKAHLYNHYYKVFYSPEMLLW